MEEDYAERLKKYTKAELRDVLTNMDKEKFPDRYALALARNQEIKDGPDPIPEPEPKRGQIPEKYRTGWRRFGAMIIDGIVLNIVAVLLVLGMYPFAGSSTVDSDTFKSILDPLYAVWMTTVYGRTVGKRALGLRVLTYPEETPIGFRTAVIREIFPVCVVFLFFPLGFLTRFIENEIASALFVGLSFVVALGALAWGVLEIMTMLGDEKRRAFHDKIAGTVVIYEQG